MMPHWRSRHIQQDATPLWLQAFLYVTALIVVTFFAAAAMLILIGSLPLKAQHRGNLCGGLIASAVEPLLTPRGPSAVGRFVVSIVVDPIERHFPWSGSHIFHEALEPVLSVFAVPPAVTDFDASSAVPLVRRNVWVLASTNHHPPKRVMLGAACAVRSIPVCPGNGALGVNTPAGIGSSARQERGLNNALISTVTITDPINKNAALTANGLPRSRPYQQFSETPSDQIHSLGSAS